MEGGAVGHNFERDPPKDHPCQVWFNSVQGFQRRRFKCESLRCTTDGRTPSDGKSSHGLWSGELKMKLSRKVITHSSFAVSLLATNNKKPLNSYICHIGCPNYPNYCNCLFYFQVGLRLTQLD